jgi:hypothetical protein
VEKKASSEDFNGLKNTTLKNLSSTTDEGEEELMEGELDEMNLISLDSSPSSVPDKKKNCNVM